MKKPKKCSQSVTQHSHGLAPISIRNVYAQFLY